MLPHFAFNEDEWVALGPGSLECIRKIFGPAVRGREYEAFRYLHFSQHEHFARLGIYPDRIPRLCKSRRVGVSMVDLEHSLCECEKYSRAKHPAIDGKRKRVAKHVWHPSRKYLTADLPEHWTTSMGTMTKLTRPPPTNLEDPSQYEVSHIVAEKRTQTQVAGQYLVRWTGYGPDDDTWQHEKDLIDGAGLVLQEWQVTRDRIWRTVAQFQDMGKQFRREKSVLDVEMKAKLKW